MKDNEESMNFRAEHESFQTSGDPLGVRDRCGLRCVRGVHNGCVDQVLLPSAQFPFVSTFSHSWRTEQKTGNVQRGFGSSMTPPESTEQPQWEPSAVDQYWYWSFSIAFLLIFCCDEISPTRLDNRTMPDLTTLSNLASLQRTLKANTTQMSRKLFSSVCGMPLVLKIS